MGQRTAARLMLQDRVCISRRAGAWRSLVAHLLWEQRVACSNHAAPTNKISGLKASKRRPFSFGEPRLGTMARDRHGPEHERGSLFR